MECPCCNTECTQMSFSPAIYECYMSDKIEYGLIANICKKCGEIGDFEAQNDVLVDRARHDAKHSAIKNILQDFNEHSYKNKFIEDKLGLRYGFLKDVLEVKIDVESTYALLKLVHKNPNFLEH